MIANIENGDYENPSQLFLTDISASGSNVPRNYVNDYLQDVNKAGQDIIDSLKTALRNIEQLFISTTPKSDDLKGSKIVDRTFSEKETRDVDIAETKNGFEEISKTGEDFLNKFRFLVEYTEKRINVSPTEQQERERKLRQAVRSSRKTEMEIKCLKDSLEIQRTEREKLMDKLNEDFNDCENKSLKIEEEIKKSTEQIVNESEIKMTKFYKDSSVTQDLLISEIKIVKTRLNNLREKNVRMENELRNKRNNVETQLLNCLSKYDEGIGSLHEQVENLTKEFELLSSQRKTLENEVMLNLRKFHDDLQQEKTEALLKIRDEKVDNFIRNRAAKVIQKAWRIYWERHCAKKKKKSRKK